MPEPLYLDASAAVKLVVEESESWALAERLADRVIISSEVCRVELARALLRLGLGVGAVRLGRRVVDRLELLRLDARVLDRACEVGSPTLRGLDAIHLASALELDRDVDAFVTYDRRLAEAAEAEGLSVLSPV
ncbi:MAG TPA: type II toxin-antitoxin system VapC family toxin [Actinomycetota bacterium]|nr:type II toxin-antitoxin system VapC family toxin [Actinomycetota bacterium]